MPIPGPISIFGCAGIGCLKAWIWGAICCVGSCWIGCICRPGYVLCGRGILQSQHMEQHILGHGQSKKKRRIYWHGIYYLASLERSFNVPKCNFVYTRNPHEVISPIPTTTIYIPMTRVIRWTSEVWIYWWTEVVNTTVWYKVEEMLLESLLQRSSWHELEKIQSFF